MRQTFTGLKGILAYPDLMAALAWKNIVMRYGEFVHDIAWTFDIMMWTCFARDSRA